ncbi:MAG: hypothetical protein U0168_13930 [Nannocystaceae bacterium]
MGAGEARGGAGTVAPIPAAPVGGNGGAMGVAIGRLAEGGTNTGTGPLGRSRASSPGLATARALAAGAVASTGGGVTTGAAPRDRRGGRRGHRLRPGGGRGQRRGHDRLCAETVAALGEATTGCAPEGGETTGTRPLVSPSSRQPLPPAVGCQLMGCRRCRRRLTSVSSLGIA